MSFLNKPYYREQDERIKLIHSSLIGLFIFSFLVIFEPFGLQNYKGNLLLLALGFGLITLFCTAFFFTILPKLLKRTFHAESWNVRKEILFISLMISCIGFINVLFANQMSLISLNLIGLLRFLGFTFMLAIFPTIVLILISELNNRKKFDKLAQEIDLAEHKPAAQNDSLQLASYNQKDQVELSPTNILFLKADGNYVEIHQT